MGSRINWKQYNKKMGKLKQKRQRKHLIKGESMKRKIINSETRSENKEKSLGGKE